MISTHHPHLDFFHVTFFSFTLISHSSSTDTAAFHSLTSCLYIWCFIRMSPTAPSRHFRRSVMLSERLCLCTLRPLRHACLWLDVSSGGTRRYHGIFSFSCLLTRLPHLHCDFIITSLHYQFVFFGWHVSPQGMSFVPFCCLCINFIYWYSLSTEYYSWRVPLVII